MIWHGTLFNQQVISPPNCEIYAFHLPLQVFDMLVARFSQIEGYRCLSLTRALGVVKCQLAVV
jgi:hypothetical protein